MQLAISSEEGSGTLTENIEFEWGLRHTKKIQLKVLRQTLCKQNKLGEHIRISQSQMQLLHEENMNDTFQSLR